MHCRVMGSYAYRIFFVSFFVIVVMVCLNVLLAFIIDMYVTRIAAGKEEKEMEKERVIEEVMQLSLVNMRSSSSSSSSVSQNLNRILP